MGFYCEILIKTHQLLLTYSGFIYSILLFSVIYMQYKHIYIYINLFIIVDVYNNNYKKINFNIELNKEISMLLLLLPVDSLLINTVIII